MNKTLKNLYITGAVILILFLIFIYVRFVIGGPEDDWICAGGEWVKHGAPSAPKPSSPCLLKEGEAETSTDCTLYSEVDCPSQCVVCPPCDACSSISCQAEEFCQSIGIDRTWYESMKKQINNFERCAAAGNPVLESYPRQCQTPEGKIFTEIIPPIEPAPIGPDTEVFTEPTEPSKDFCGDSTRGTCLVDLDCTDEICSGLCQSRDEELATAGCVTRECHDAETHSIQCKCVNEQCQWYKYPRE